MQMINDVKNDKGEPPAMDDLDDLVSVWTQNYHNSESFFLLVQSGFHCMVHLFLEWLI